MSSSRRSLAVLALALTLGAFPLGVLASHQYSDVPDSNPFHGDITAITNAGVTSGCGGGKYCPDRNVTRAEMAAFMNRLGALAANKTPVVNADRLDGLDSSVLRLKRHHALVSTDTTISAHLGDAVFSVSCALVSVTPGSGQTGEIWSPDGSFSSTSLGTGSLPFMFTATATNSSGHVGEWDGFVGWVDINTCFIEFVGQWDTLTAIA